MLTGWKLSVLGIVIVGIAGIAASSAGLIEPMRAGALFAVFVLFIGCLELMEWIKRRGRGKTNRKPSSK
ncbi:hypothetical protein BBD41_26255 [Paenibacillus ihbetae]|uniref:Uncharacterized protein n=1 Tax=Paenibacillus ihbetae TaxID=1870820 RepID=A0A1B2E7A9_9BACL|nr:hypothetical protein [Paenibacillus ihbetae]ANY75797.1 hypothetical protein BBD41_26255 [Paenibacillus ihbetae]